MSDTIQVRLTEGPLGPTTSTAPPGVGAWIVFDGIVRPLEDDHPLVALHYEAYQPMTSRELERLASDISDKHGLLAMIVEHSIGRVGVGETSFRLSIGSAHRAEGIAAMDEFIRRMKRDVPLWKNPEFS